MKKILLIVMFCMGRVFAQTPDSARIDAWLDEARSLLNADIAAGEALALKALDASQKINYPKGIGKAYMRLGVAMVNEGKNDSALYYFKNALAIRKKLGDVMGAAGALREISYVFRSKSEVDSAFNYCFQALRMNESAGNKSEIGMNYQDIGTLYLNYGNDKEAKNYFDKAITILTEAGDSTYLSSAYNKLGNFYYSKSEYPQAIQHYSKALAIDDRQGNSISEAQNIANIAACYFYQKKYALAKQYYHRALAFDMENDIQSELPVIYNALGSVFSETGESDSAIYYLNKCILLSEETENKELQADAYQTLSTAYRSQGEFRLALDAHERFASINDSLLNNEKVKQIAEMQTKYETEKKDNKIVLLNKDNDLKVAENRRVRLQFTFSLLALLVGAFFLGLVFYQKNKIGREKKRSDALLLNILPAETAEELKATGTAQTKNFRLVSVLFTDFKDFTQASEMLSPEDLVKEINYCYSKFDEIVEKHAVEKIKTIGDSYMCAGGLPTENSTHPVDVVLAAIEMQEFISSNKAERENQGLPFLELRLGIHSGPVIAGIVGTRKFAYDIWGDTVNTASRMESSGEAGKINISGSTYELVKHKFKCTYRGKVQAKNKGEIDMYFVDGLYPAEN